VETPSFSLDPRADDVAASAVYRLTEEMLPLRTLTTGRRSNELSAPWLDPRAGRASVEVIVMRLFGVAWLLLTLLSAALTHPRPGLHGRAAVVLVALIALVSFTVASRPWGKLPLRRRIAALAGITAASAAIVAVKPDAGLWPDGPLLVGLIAAFWLSRTAAALVLALSVAVLSTVAVVVHRPGAVVTVFFTAVPWFLVMRLMRELATQRNALHASREAEAQAAALAERARLAREMHDVLAHSLSALALHLESTRLLANSRGADPDLTRAIDQAHQLAAGGLQEARRAIATARGDELPGPDRLGVLADAFTQQSGLPVALAVHGEPRVLEPDARLAVYRTAQEALTNVRRHATAEQVAIDLSYLPRSTVLVVEDRSPAGTPPPAPLAVSGAGYGLTGMRERAELLGGELLAEPTGTGFRVELRLPS
jgi:signal transduction histidine kinase